MIKKTYKGTIILFITVLFTLFFTGCKSENNSVEISDQLDWEWKKESLVSSGDYLNPSKEKWGVTFAFGQTLDQLYENFKETPASPIRMRDLVHMKKELLPNQFQEIVMKDIEGKEVKLSHFKNSNVIVYLWDSTQEAALPDVQALEKAMSSNNLWETTKLLVVEIESGPYPPEHLDSKTVHLRDTHSVFQIGFGGEAFQIFSFDWQGIPVDFYFQEESLTGEDCVALLKRLPEIEPKKQNKG